MTWPRLASSIYAAFENQFTIYCIDMAGRGCFANKKWGTAEAREEASKGIVETGKWENSRGTRNHILNFHKRVRRASSCHFIRVSVLRFLTFLLFFSFTFPFSLRSIVPRVGKSLCLSGDTKLSKHISFILLPRSQLYHSAHSRHLLSLCLYLSRSGQVDVITDKRRGCSLLSSASRVILVCSM